MALESVNGRQTFFGPSERTALKYGGVVSGTGAIKVAKWEFEYDDLPADDDGNAMLMEIPANSLIRSAVLKVGTAWAGGTNVNLGLAQTDGTVIDADGIDAAIATAALTANAIIDCDGALVGASVGANDAVLEVTVSGTYTAGTAVLEVEYQELK